MKLPPHSSSSLLHLIAAVFPRVSADLRRTRVGTEPGGRCCWEDPLAVQVAVRAVKAQESPGLVKLVALPAVRLAVGQKVAVWAVEAQESPGVVMVVTLPAVGLTVRKTGSEVYGSI